MSWQWVQHTPSTAYTEYSIHQTQHTPSTAFTKYSIHRVQHTPSTAYTEYSIHRVQHTPSTAYTEYSIHRVKHPPKNDCLYFILMNTSWCLNVASASGAPPYTIDRHQPGQLKGYITLSHSHGRECTNWRNESLHPPRRPSTTYKYLSELAPLRPTSSHDHGLQGHLQTHTITASKLARS